MSRLPVIIQNSGVPIRPISQQQIEADRVAEREAKGGRFHQTEHGTVTHAGAIRCARCGGRAYRDADEAKCMLCGRTLGWFGSAPISQRDAQTALSEEKSSEQHRNAARARWSGRSNACRCGLRIEGDNVVRRGEGRVECRACYLKKHATCPIGHTYTEDNTQYRSDRKRLCLTCQAERRAARKRAKDAS